MSNIERILIVDDDQRMCDSLMELLGDRRYELTASNSAKEAIAYFEAYVFDLVFLDIVMPDESGYSVMEYIKSQNIDTPVIVMTGQASTESAIEALRKGAYDYLRKPFQSQELLATTENALNHRRLKDENKQATEALRESEGRLRLALKAANMAIWEADLGTGELQYEQAESLFGLDRESLSRTVTAFRESLFPEDRKQMEDAVNRGLLDNAEYKYEFRMIGADDKTRWYERRGKPIVGESGRPVRTTGTLMDITERKRAEKVLNSAHDRLESKIKERTAQLLEANKLLEREMEDRKGIQDQLVRSERLAATGQLAASIAHEINSPLQAVTSMLGTMEEKYDDDKEIGANIDLLHRAVGNIRDTVKHLLDLNRPGEDAKQHTNVNSIVETTVNLLQAHLKRNKVIVTLNLSSEIPNINGSPQRLNQVLMNLINNAIEAMRGASKPRDGWMHRTGPGATIDITTRCREQNVLIRVADTGPGISKADLEHIFDPFYTRKKPMSMGVGLTLCHGIIEDHGGTITAANSQDTGAVFTIMLPAAE